MKKLLLFVCFLVSFAFANEIFVNSGETKTINGVFFENYSGDFVIKNNGILILENCTFKNNRLGSKENEALLSSEKVIAPVINYGELSVSNCKFIDNFSWNTALTNDFEAQASAGAIVNFGELDLSDNNIFKNNSYQKGHFAVIKNDYINQFEYIGNDLIYNAGNVEIIRTVEENQQPQNASGLQVDVVMLNNLVSDKAEFLVKTNKSAEIKITILNNVSNLVFSTQRQVQNNEIIVWNLKNQAGNNVASGVYFVKVETDNFVKSMQFGVQR
ncbi:MAG: T9SS type A sorting domain-containing protein [Bacteroidales bacterium]|jgi:hypothetical protein|nr:T9SS type A sorting domain-containing protein [Bacteroidales bacterium]